MKNPPPLGQDLYNQLWLVYDQYQQAVKNYFFNSFDFELIQVPIVIVIATKNLKTALINFLEAASKAYLRQAIRDFASMPYIGTCCSFKLQTLGLSKNDARVIRTFIIRLKKDAKQLFDKFGLQEIEHEVNRILTPQK